MAIVVQKQDRENTQGLIRRFTKRVQQSGVLVRARKIRFFQRPKSHSSKQKAALRKEELRKVYLKLKKMGQLEK